MQNLQNITSSERRLRTKEYMVYDDINDSLGLTHNDRHQKVVSWGLGGGSEFTGGARGTEATFGVMKMFCILIWVTLQMYAYSQPPPHPHPIRGFHICRFNQPCIENTKQIKIKIPKSSKKQNLNSPGAGNYNVYTVFTTIYITFTLY